jgi:hypothetical protein
VFVIAVAVVLSDVVVAEKAIALIALGADRLVTNSGPVSPVNVVWNWRIAGVMFGVHTDLPLPRMSEKHTAFSEASG